VTPARPWVHSPAMGRLALTLSIAVAAFAVTAIGLPPAAVAGSLASPVAKVVPVPPGFVGIDADAPLFEPTAPLNPDRQLDEMVANGVESVRVAFDWAAAQPYESWADVPADQQGQFTNVGGEPMDFSATDQVVGLAAQRGLTVLPTVLYTPGWDAKTNRDGLATPAKTAPYATYLSALVHRYGPHGTYWALHPGIPRLSVRMWQIWNEPNLSYYWPQPFASSYVALLRAAHGAIKSADPGAQVVLGALTNFAWRSIGQIYRISGARHLFDIVAANGFSKTPSNVILFLRLMRNALIHLGDGHKPLLATEVSWPSAQGKSPQHYDFNTTEAGQARNIAALLPMLGSQRTQLRLVGFYYYTWVGAETPHAPAFSFAGLLALRGNRLVAKPALAAYRAGALALEQCRQKAAVATRCAKPAS
jgi:hypothetical protein